MPGKTILCFVALLIPSRVPAQRSPRPTAGELAEISQRGRMLAEYDAASWHSRSAVLALQPEPGTFGRQVARKVDNGWVVAYGRLSEPRDKFLITYEAASAVSPDQFTVKKFDPPREDKEFYLSGARAIETGRSVFVGEKRPYNDAVLPTKSGQLYVYIYPAQTHDDVYTIGGDVRYLVSPDGSTIQGTRRLHNAVLDAEDPVKSGQVEEGWSVEMSVHSHTLDDVPEDTDVFFAMMRKPPIPELIVSSEYTYVVFPDGSITYKGKSPKLFGKKKLATFLAGTSGLDPAHASRLVRESPQNR